MGAGCTTASPRTLAPTIIAREATHGIVMNAPTLHGRRTSARGVRPLVRDGSDLVRHLVGVAARCARASRAIASGMAE